eukprot:CAMPEP_0117064644 /NCGR_PEP_ID=MMETSP0472-20121206/45160_1 /TAXON_ID=693140 ORGANISM="Tiarina fusus, Strain LIS" /NCGR_SAMPLE_ID=MMETSP0472 /ASSEMBLY_ACC=CAM_ASM_000603 /LENGTH=84 /DNA_ID=CAMNT_0004784891 /DNA_START=160 /DNA_END=415 /DNA_ORIENTATION=-
MGMGYGWGDDEREHSWWGGDDDRHWGGWGYRAPAAVGVVAHPYTYGYQVNTPVASSTYSNVDYSTYGNIVNTVSDHNLNNNANW